MQTGRLGFATVLIVAIAPAQESKPTFEVASIKKVDQAPTPFNGARDRGGMFSRPAITPAQLIQFAYGLRDFQVLGGPAWARDDVFEVQARAGESDVPRDRSA
jgi:uncharacterized protein (TIGR03435 family)